MTGLDLAKLVPLCEKMTTEDPRLTAENAALMKRLGHTDEEIASIFAGAHALPTLVTALQAVIHMHRPIYERTNGYACDHCGDEDHFCPKGFPAETAISSGLGDGTQIMCPDEPLPPLVCAHCWDDEYQCGYHPCPTILAIREAGIDTEAGREA